MGIGCPLKPDVDITSEQERVVGRRQTVQHVSELTEEAGSDRPGAVEHGDDAR